jgi:hypothetical protein
MEHVALGESTERFVGQLVCQSGAHLVQRLPRVKLEHLVLETPADTRAKLSRQRLGRSLARRTLLALAESHTQVAGPERVPPVALCFRA